MDINRIQHRIIGLNSTILSALKLMGANHVKMLLVFDNQQFKGVLTMEDIQRAIIRNIPLTDGIESILDSDKQYAQPEDTIQSIRERMLTLRAECMPVVDRSGNLKHVWLWEDFFQEPIISNSQETIHLPVVIMAGGKGTRLKPITNVIPKPMVPIGDKTIIEEIMDRFERIGCNKFYMSVNYKADMIKLYLDQLEHSYSVEFFEESKPLGTIGSVSLLKGRINTTFIVSNCDILIDQDFRDIYDYHLLNHNDITVITAVKSLLIPYGVIETGENGLIQELKEKPEVPFMINTGVYILESHCIEDIPQGVFFHITDLIKRIKKKGGRVGCFPISDSAWRDMGDWPDYLKMIQVI